MKYEEVSKRFNRLLEVYEITSAELSKRSGVLKSSISGYVNGNSAPSNFNAQKIADCFPDINPVWLCGFDVPMYKTSNVDFDVVLTDDEKEILIEVLNKVDRREDLLQYADYLRKKSD